jgi:hypothetical protein
LLLILAGSMAGQLTTGMVRGTLRDANGRAVPRTRVVIAGPNGFRAVVQTNDAGEFAAVLSYGRYQIAGKSVFVAPLQTTEFDAAASAAVQSYPEAFSLHGALLGREPATVTEPLDFSGLSDTRLGLASQAGVSWTATQYRLQGIDATDSYQPGRPVTIPDTEVWGQMVASPASRVGIFLTEPGPSWHGAISSWDSGSGLAGSNLPPPAGRGLVRQPDRFGWFTRDGVETGGPLTNWADLFLSGRGQWASQTVPLAAPGNDQQSRMLFGNARGRVRSGERDQFDALASGSRIDLSTGGMPAGIEALAGNRISPNFVLPGGFPGQPETDHADFVQAGWTHQFAPEPGWGILEARYGFSTAHLETRTPPAGQSRIELLNGAVTGASPLGNLAVRTRQSVEASWQPAPIRTAGIRHRIAAGGGWNTSSPRNRFTQPSDMNLVTAGGAPAFVLMFNPSSGTRETIRSFSLYATDRITLARTLSLEAGAGGDFSRGSVQAQPGTLISWNSVSPNAGFAWQVPRSPGLILRGAYSRSYSPLAGRYLDFGDPEGLGGNAYQWDDSNLNGLFDAGERGVLLMRFGGAVSSIAPALRRPYADELSVGAGISLPSRSSASIRLFRRDEKDRIAAVDTGVPAQAFLPVAIADPGPDGIPGTFDDQSLTVYRQDPGTLGQDRYLLTNPAGLRMLNTGIVAQIRTEWRGLAFHASFLAEKSYGPANPGDAAFENDPGVIGALFLDPNTSVHAAGRSFMDRGYAGKIQAIYRLPWGGIDIASIAEYADGLAFARQLLVTGLAQGPVVVAATVRGSPNGGNRAAYVLNWNLRLSRSFPLGYGALAASADFLNVTNSGHKIQESDLSGPAFNLRLPEAIQPPLAVRLGFRYEF